MSEFLYRGYNVAVPAVDVGDDVYVVEDQQGTMWRLQIKTSDDVAQKNVGTYSLSRRQLREIKANELFYMFMLRWQQRWRFVLIAREQLALIRSGFEIADRAGKRGRKPIPDAYAQTDTLTLMLEWSASDATGWGTSFAPYLDKWPDTFPDNPDGPGAVAKAP